VTKQLPENRDEFEYRIKGVEEVHECMSALRGKAS
jgi:hypothetical protein